MKTSREFRRLAKRQLRSKGVKTVKGFTLVELIVVIAIIGVLAAILIPTMMGRVKESKLATANDSAAKIAEELAVLIVDWEQEGTLTPDDTYSADAAADAAAAKEAVNDNITAKLQELVPAVKNGHYAVAIEKNAIVAVAFAKDGDKYIGTYPVQAKGPVGATGVTAGSTLEGYLGNAAGRVSKTGDATKAVGDSGWADTDSKAYTVN